VGAYYSKKKGGENMETVKSRLESEHPVWEKVYAVVKDAPVETVFYFPTLCNKTGLTIKEIQNTKRKVDKKLLETENKMLISQRSKGYKISTPNEQIVHATHRQKKARHQIKWGGEELLHVDQSTMSNEEKVRLGHMTNWFAGQLKLLRTRTYKVSVAQDKVDAVNVVARAKVSKANEKAKDALKTLIEGVEVMMKQVKEIAQ
jgi:uncharacterized protein YxjI